MPEKDHDKIGQGKIGQDNPDQIAAIFARIEQLASYAQDADNQDISTKEAPQEDAVSYESLRALISQYVDEALAEKAPDVITEVIAKILSQASSKQR